MYRNLLVFSVRLADTRQLHHDHVSEQDNRNNLIYVFFIPVINNDIDVHDVYCKIV